MPCQYVVPCQQSQGCSRCKHAPVRLLLFMHAPTQMQGQRQQQGTALYVDLFLLAEHAM